MCLQVKKEVTDLFGTCPTLYIYDRDKGEDITTLRKLPECRLHQIYMKQFAVFSSTIRSLTGGVEQRITDEVSMRLECMLSDNIPQAKRKYRILHSLESKGCSKYPFGGI